MKKNSTKKIVMLLLSLMLVFALSVSMIACNNNANDDDDDDNKEEITDELTLKNGEFEFFTGTDFPATPKSWTGSEKVSHDDDEDDDTVYYSAGVVNVKDGEYSPSDYNGAANPGQVGDDNYILMINNREKTAYSYTSTSVSLKDNYYLFTFNIKTNISSDTPDAVASIKLTNGGSRVYAEFPAVNTNGEWVSYKIYVRGPEISSKSVYVELALGSGTKETDTTLAKGYAYFDSLYCDESTEEAFAAADITDEFTQIYNFTVPNGNFTNVYSSSSYPKSPYDWATQTGKDEDGNNLADTSGITATGVINVSDEVWDPDFILSSSEEADEGIVSSTVNPGKPAGAYDDNILVIRSTAPTAKGYYTTSSIRFKRGGFYQLSVWVKTELTAGKVTLKLGDKLTISDVDTNGEWKLYSFFIEGSYSENNDLAFHVWLGEGDALNTEKYAQGVVYIDGLTRTEFETLSEYEAACASVDDAQKVQKSFVTTNLLTDTTDTPVSTDYIKAASKWVGSYAENHGTPYNTVSGIIDLSNFNASELGDIDVIEPVTNRETSAILIWNQEKSAYSLVYDNDSDTDTDDITINPNTCYRLSVWVYTVNVETGKGLSVYLINHKDGEENTISSATLQNTYNEDEETSEWREVVFYIQGAKSEVNRLSLKLEFGNGSFEDPSVYTSGYALASNIYLEECAYSKYSSASTGDTIKSYSYLTSSSTTISNAGFDNYILDKSEASFDENGNFNRMPATPSGWTGAAYGKGAASADKSNVISGIVNNDVISYLESNAEYTDFPISTLPYNDSMALEYNGYPNALMIWNRSETAYGYTLSSYSLSASSYYKLTVNVNTTAMNAGTGAAIVIENETENASFLNIDTTTDSENVNGWVQYTFYIEVGLQSTTIDIGLWLGRGDNTETNTHAKGLVLFDNVYLKNITSEINDVDEEAGETPKDKFDAITTSAKVVKMNLKTDSFTTTSETNPSTPANFTGSVDGSAPSGSDYTVSGVIDVTQTIESGKFGDIDVISVFNPENGPNFLLVYNADLTAYNYTSSSYTFNTDSYYMVSVKVKTSALTDGKGANVNLIVGDNTYKMSEKAIVKSDDAWTTYTFLVDTANTSKTVKLTLGLGIYEEDDEGEAITTGYAKGYVAFDDVVFESLTETEFEDAKNAIGDSTKDYLIELSDEDEENNSGEGNLEDKEGLTTWEIIAIVSGSVLGLAIIGVLIAWYIKKLLPKIKAKRNKKYKKAAYDKNAISKDAKRKTKDVNKYND